jgi:hypothetical protein
VLINHLFYLLTSTTLSAPDKEAPRYLFDVASTPAM